MAAPMSEPLQQPQTPITSQEVTACRLVPKPRSESAISGQLSVSWCSAPHPHPTEGQTQRGTLSLHVFCLPFPQIFSPQPQKTTCQWVSEGRLLLRVHGDGLDWVPWSLFAPYLTEHFLLLPSPSHHTVGTKLSAQFLLRNDYCLHERQPCRAMAGHASCRWEQAFPAQANWICWA